jgi:DNA-binding NarL/FixJ family response regulator
MRSRILLADDHPLVLEGLRRILDRPEFEIVDMVRDGRALVAAAHKLKPDAIIADISMPLLSGVEAARRSP